MASDQETATKSGPAAGQSAGPAAARTEAAGAPNAAERLTAARKRMDLALGRLEAAVERRLSGGRDSEELQQQVQHLSDDRVKMAEEIDALRRANRKLVAANADAIRRIDGTVATIETVLGTTDPDTGKD